MTTKPKLQKYFIKGSQILLIKFRYGSSNFLSNFITKKRTWCHGQCPLSSQFISDSYHILKKPKMIKIFG